METAAQVFGVFLVLDLIAATGLTGLVWLLQRRARGPAGERLPAGEAVGMLLVLAAAAAMIYAGIWILGHFGR